MKQQDAQIPETEADFSLNINSTYKFCSSSSSMQPFLKLKAVSQDFLILITSIELLFKLEKR